MECDTHDVEKNNRKMSLLDKKGFKCGMVDRNCMCTHKDFKANQIDEKSTLRRWNGHAWAKEYSPAYIAFNPTS